MSNIICITSQIARSGKTAAAVGIATAYALLEKKTLLIDCDPQGVATNWAGFSRQAQKANIYHAFMGQVPADDIILQHDLEYLSVLPAGIEFFQAEHKLAVKPGKEMILHRIVKRLAGKYEFVIVDSPSTLGFFTICSLAAADWAVIPVNAKNSSFFGLDHLLDIIRMVRGELNPNLKVAGMVMTMNGDKHDVPDTDSEQPFNEIADSIFKRRIPRDETVALSHAKCLPVQLLDIMSKGAQSYLELAIELNSRTGQ